jgi:hypothetical protein
MTHLAVSSRFLAPQAGNADGTSQRRPLMQRPAELYGLPLEEFTRERDTLARELKRAGRKEAAEEVRGLRKPPVFVWAINQAARRRPDVARALVKAGADLRKAQRGAVSGRSPGGLQDATRAHRGLVDELTGAAHEALEERGGVAPAVVTKVAQTLRAASVDKEASKALVAGTLAEDVEQAGFGPLLSAVPSRPQTGRPAAPKPKPKPKPAAKSKPPPKPKPDPNIKRRAKVQEQLDRARAKVRELEERLEQLTSD